MQPHGAGRLGRPDTVQALPAEAGHELVVDHGRRVDDSPQRPAGLFGSDHKSLGDSGLGDIAQHNDDVSLAFELSKVAPQLVRRGSPTVENDDTSSAAVDKPAGHCHADTAEPAGDDVRAIRAHYRVAPERRKCAARESRSTYARRPPGDHVIAARRLEFGGQRRNRIAGPIQIEQSGA